MVSVSASVNLPLHHKVQKFSSGTGSPGWSWKKGRKTVVVYIFHVIPLPWGGTSKPITFLGSGNDSDDYLLQPHFVRKNFFMPYITEFWNSIAFREFSKTFLLLQISTITVQH